MKGIFYYCTGNMNEALTYCLQAEEISTKHGRVLKNSLLYRVIGLAYQYKNEFKKSIINFTKGIKYLKKNDHKNYLALYAQRSCSYAISCDFKKSKKDVKKAEKKIHNISDHTFLSIIYRNCSFYYIFSTQNINKGKIYAEKSLQEAQKSNNFFQSYFSLIPIITSNYYNSEFDKVIEKCTEMIKTAQEKDIGYIHGSVYYYLCVSLIMKNDFIKSKNLAKEKLYNSTSNHIYKNFIYGCCKYYENNMDEAINYFHKAFCLSKKSDSNMLRIINYVFYSFILEESGKTIDSNYILKELYETLPRNKYIKILVNKAKGFCKTIKDYKKRNIENNPVKVKEKIQLKNIIEVSQMLTKIKDLKKLLNFIVKKAMELSGAQSGAIFIWNNYKKDFDDKLTIKIDINNEKFFVSKKIIKQIQFNKKGIFISKSENYIKSIICSPIIYDKEFIGFIYIENRLLENVFNNLDLKVITGFASQTALAIKNSNYKKEQKNSKKSLPENLTLFCKKYDLTKQEENIINYMLKGFSHKDISKILFISSATVRRHVHNIYNKTGVNNKINLYKLTTNHTETL